MTPDNPTENPVGDSGKKAVEFKVTVIGDEYHLEDDADGKIGKTVLANTEKALRDKGLGLDFGDRLTLNFADQTGKSIGTVTEATRIRVQALIDEAKAKVLMLFLKSAWKRKDESDEENRVPLPKPSVQVAESLTFEELGLQARAGAVEAASGSGRPAETGAAASAGEHVEQMKVSAAKMVEDGGDQQKPPVSPEMEAAILHLLEDRRDREQKAKDPYAGVGEKKTGRFSRFLMWASGQSEDEEEVSPVLKKLKEKLSIGHPWATKLLEVRKDMIERLGEDSDEVRPSEVLSIVGLGNRDMQVGAAVMDLLMQIVEGPEGRASMFHSKRVSSKDLKLIKLWLREYRGITPSAEQVGGGTNSLTLDRVLLRLNSDVPAIRTIAINQLPLVADQEIRACGTRDFDETRAQELAATFNRATLLSEFDRLNQGDRQVFIDKQWQVGRTIARRTDSLRGESVGGTMYGSVNVDSGAERRREKLSGGS